MKNIFLITALLFIPHFSHAQILFSEIAWMGTDTATDNEWIEIYNFSNTPTDLTGWTLTSDDGKINIALSNALPRTLAPHAVGVLERTDDTTLPGVTALLTYTGALANDGATLTLKDGSGTTSDQAVGGSKWESIGGSNTEPKKTPQRTRTGTWVTATPTPGRENAETNDPVIIPVATTTSQTYTPSESSSKGGGTSKSEATKKEAVIANSVLSLAFGIPRTVYVNEKVNFEAVPSGLGTTFMDSLQYTWNFGDTYTRNGKKTSHTFTRPGAYTVVLLGAYAKHDAMVRHDVTVLPTVFEITRASNADLVVHNKSPEEINLGDFTLGLRKEFIFPKYTFVKADGSLTIPKERIQNVRGPMSLLDTEGVVVAYEKTVAPKPALPASVILSRPTPQMLLSTARPVLPKEKVELKTNPDAATQTAQLIEPTKETIFQIGKDNTKVEEKGFVTRMFQKVTTLFGF